MRPGTAPDIFWLEPDWIAFAKSGYLAPFDGYVFATLELGESHYYFHTGPGALMFLIASLALARPRRPMLGLLDGARGRAALELRK